MHSGIPQQAAGYRFIDSTGVIKDRHKYFAYGDNLSQVLSTGQSHKYTGQGLDMNWA